MALEPLGRVVLAPIASISPYPGNPRKMPQQAVELVAASIREFGWQQPLILDKDMIIIAGHTRYEAAKHLELAEVPAIIAEHLTPEQARAFRIADNRTHDYTTWDYPQLMAELDGLDEDFAGILALADWQSIISQLEEAGDAAGLSLDPGDAALLATGPHLTVTFDSQESADRAAPGILDLPGVIHVSYSPR